MLNALIRFSLRYRMLIVVLSMTLMVYGSYLATTLPIDVFPDLDRPRVVILTECPGLATEEVETLVTQPIEIAILGASGVQAVRSQSTAGLNVVYVEFDWTTDVRTARQTVQERLATLAGVLPETIRPQMTPTASIMGQIVIGGMYRQSGPKGGLLLPIPNAGLMAEVIDVTKRDPQILVWKPMQRRQPGSWQSVPVEKVEWLKDEGQSEHAAIVYVAGVAHELTIPTPLEQQMALRTLADWVVRPRLLKIPGIAEVFTQGGERKQYQILVNPASLIEHDVSLQEVERALAESNINTSGGFAVQGESERPIRIIGRVGPDEKRVLDDLRKVPVKNNPARPVLIGDVARSHRRTAIQTRRRQHQWPSRRRVHDCQTAAYRYSSNHGPD